MKLSFYIVCLILSVMPNLQAQESDKDAVVHTKEILFIIESYGNMPAKDILVGAIKALTGNLSNFEKNIK